MYWLRSIVPNVDYLEGYQWSGFWGGAVYGFVTWMFFSDCCMIGFWFFLFLNFLFFYLKKNPDCILFHNSLCDILVHFVYAKTSHFGYTIFTNLKNCIFHLGILAFLQDTAFYACDLAGWSTAEDRWLVLCSGSTHYMFHNFYIC